MPVLDRLIGQRQFDCDHKWRTISVHGKPFLQRCRRCEAQRPVRFVGRREPTPLDDVAFLGREAR